MHLRWRPKLHGQDHRLCSLIDRCGQGSTRELFDRSVMTEPRELPSCFGSRGLATARPRTGVPIDHEELAEVARALAHPARVAIVEQFADGRPKMTKELVTPSGLAASTMSEHLRILREAGVIVSRHDGSRVWYCLCRDRLTRFAETVDDLSRRRCDHLAESGPMALPMFVEQRNNLLNRS